MSPTHTHTHTHIVHFTRRLTGECAELMLQTVNYQEGQIEKEKDTVSV